MILFLLLRSAGPAYFQFSLFLTEDQFQLDINTKYGKPINNTNYPGIVIRIYVEIKLNLIF